MAMHLAFGFGKDHPVLEEMIAGIAADRGQSPDQLAQSMQMRCQALLDFVAAPQPPRVELRRWWSWYDAATPLLRIWHTMLFCLHAKRLMMGEQLA